MANVLRVLHLVGSAADDFHADLSRLYAGGCLSALADRTRYDTHIAYVSPDGSWRFPGTLTARALAQTRSWPITEALQHIVSIDVDVVIPQMFCLPGMTAYRALFDILGVPYLGNKPDVMAVGADKARARAVVAAAGVAVPAGEVLARGQRRSLPLPVVVKPVDGDNSVGVSLARNPAEYDAAVKSAFAHSDAVLVEQYVELGREVRCGIVVRDGELVCLPLEEYAVNPDTKPIRTNDDKIARNGDGGLCLVAKNGSRAWIVRDDELLTKRVWAAARRAHRALGCRHYSLFDFRIDPGGRPWFLEAGLYCSYAPSSVISAMAAAIGLSVTDLFDIGMSEVRRERIGCLTSPS
jgi:D-alanine-D-alanine ligase